MYAVILAGGGGTRLWPLSRPARPKPFLPLIGDRTLLQRTWDRIVPDLVAAEDVAVVTDRRYVDIVREQLPELRRGHAPGRAGRPQHGGGSRARGDGAGRPDDDVMLVLPADHLVADEPGFRAILRGRRARRPCRRRRWPGRLVTLGIAPDGPETGYGYIVAGDGDRRATRARSAVSRFVEKPSADAARALLAGPAPVAWNAGIFLWRRDAHPGGLRGRRRRTSSRTSRRACGRRGGLDVQPMRGCARRPSTTRSWSRPPRLGASRCCAPRSGGATSAAGAACGMRCRRRLAAATRRGRGRARGVVGRGPRHDLGSERTLVLAADRPDRHHRPARRDRRGCRGRGPRRRCGRRPAGQGRSRLVGAPPRLSGQPVGP